MNGVWREDRIFGSPHLLSMANINSPSPANEISIFNGGLFYLPLTPCPSKDSILCPSCLCSFCWGGEEEAGSENRVGSFMLAGATYAGSAASRVGGGAHHPCPLLRRIRTHCHSQYVQYGASFLPQLKEQYHNRKPTKLRVSARAQEDWNQS